MARLFGKKKPVEVIEGNETGSMNMETQGLSQGQIIRKKFFQHKPAVAGMIFMILFKP